MQIQTTEESITISATESVNSIETIINEVALKVAPLWSLENFVAVNPYLGSASQEFAKVAQELSYINEIDSTMSTEFYFDKIRNNEIIEIDIEQALKNNSQNFGKNASSFIKNLYKAEETNSSLPSLGTVIEIASQVTGKEWQRFAIQRISLWCASHFDKGQAHFKINNNDNLFASWKKEATIDRTPEIAGLLKFKKHLQDIPNEPLEAIEYNLSNLGLSETSARFYLQRLAMGLNGWCGYASKLDYDAKLQNLKSNVVLEIIAVLTSWELCTFLALKNEPITKKWKETVLHFEQIKENKIQNPDLEKKLILQEALNYAIQRKLIAKFNVERIPTPQEELAAEIQAVFCIDVRSEIYRRNLEQTNNKIQTYGFAGFFGFPVNFFPFGKKDSKPQSPVLLHPKLDVFEKFKEKIRNNESLNNLKLKNEIINLSKSFKSGSVSCFVFVSPLGLLYIPKLISETFKIPNSLKVYNFFNKIKKSKPTVIDLKHEEDMGIPIETQVEMAKNALTAMSLTSNFGKYVLLVGHGSTTKNNPYGSALHCGACGGHSGEVNAKVAAEVFNNNYVRTRLRDYEINIPNDTFFLACLHNTTTDEISIFNESDARQVNKDLLTSLKNNLKTATDSTRTERALRMFSESNKTIAERSKDWSQVRPEWGLAGCNAFLISKPQRTKNLNLAGKVFLHTYDCEKDSQNNILQAIMTAPMIVTSWISLQYYASTVDNKKLGSGNKTLHNITAGIGIIEGFSGDLRNGLPWQSVSDGDELQHTPSILNVIVEASLESLNEVIENNQNVRELVDNGWLKLLQMDNHGIISNRYTGNLNWETI